MKCDPIWENSFCENNNFEEIINQIQPFYIRTKLNKVFKQSLTGFQVCQTLWDPYAKGTNINV